MTLAAKRRVVDGSFEGNMPPHWHTLAIPQLDPHKLGRLNMDISGLTESGGGCRSASGVRTVLGPKRGGDQAATGV